jgi:hypothetical protein
MMDFQFHYLVNSGLCWFIVLMSLAGYFLTLKRMKQKWMFWVLLAIGWTFLAITNTLSVMHISQGTSYLFAIWQSSYVLVFASLVLLFIKLVQIMKVKEQG